VFAIQSDASVSRSPVGMSSISPSCSPSVNQSPELGVFSSVTAFRQFIKEHPVSYCCFCHFYGLYFKCWFSVVESSDSETAYRINVMIACQFISLSGATAGENNCQQ